MILFIRMIKNKQLLKLVGTLVFVLFCGVLILVFYSGNAQIFSQGVDSPSRKSSINIEEIRMNMENMNREEIEETIKTIEKEIERLKSEI